MNGQSKVVPFEKLQNKQATRHSPNKVFVEGRSVFIGGVAERMPKFFAKIDDELFKLSERASNDSLQSLYFNSMRYLRRERDGIQESYLRDLTGVYEAFWRNKPHPGLGQNKSSWEFSEMALLADEVLEESLAISGMVEKGSTLFCKELYALDRRFTVLLGKPSETAIAINPVSPLVMCRLFASSLVGLTLGLEVKLLIYKMFDRHVLSSFGPVYNELNVRMVRAGVLPSLPRNGLLRRPKVGDAPTAQSTLGAAREHVGKSAMVERADTFEAMRKSLEAWRCRFGSARSPGYRDVGGDAADGVQVIKILRALQQPNQGLSLQSRALSGEEMKRLIASQVSSFRADGKTSTLECQVEDVIDMVGMVFLYMLEDPRLPGSIKSMLASLQIPILKIALLEKSFFAKANHPARLLLNSIAQASMGLDSDVGADNPIYQKIKSIVDRLLVDLGRDADLLYALQEDFTAFMAVEHRKVRSAEERTRQATQSKEQFRQAKRAVAYVMVSKLNGVAIPAILKAFLYNVWKDVLVLAWLRLNREPDNWNSAIALMDQLVASMALVDGGGGQMEDSDGLLLDAIKCRLESLAHEQYWIMELFRELAFCLRARSHGLPPSVWGGGEVGLALCGDLGVVDTEFALLMDEIRRNLHDGEGLCEAGTDLLGVAGIFAREVVPVKAEVDDEFLGMASSLGIGQWIEFTEGCSRQRRAKLSWKSRESDLYVFVNAKGAKVLEVGLVDLAASFRCGLAKAIEDQCVPLMDRAFSKVMRFLARSSELCAPS